MKFRTWNREKIKSKKMELEKFPGYLPALVEFEIDACDWWQFLKRIGLYD